MVFSDQTISSTKEQPNTFVLQEKQPGLNEHPRAFNKQPRALQVCKVDVNRHGVLAAASARKLDKGGYSLQEPAVVALCSQSPGVLDVDKALAELLCESGSVLAASSKSHEEVQVEAWVAKFFRGGVADILEVSWGASVVSEAARLRGFRVPPCFTHLALSYGIACDLELDSHLRAISSAIELFSPCVLVVNLMLAVHLSGQPVGAMGASLGLLLSRGSLGPSCGLTLVSSCGRRPRNAHCRKQHVLAVRLGSQQGRSSLLQARCLGLLLTPSCKGQG